MALYVTRPRRDEVRIGRGLPSDIMQAQARAMSADEKELNRVSRSCDNYSDLGLPPGIQFFSTESCCKVIILDVTQKIKKNLKI